jgi:Holliday junction resolvase
MSGGAYLKGARWERSLKNELEQRGFFVIRSAHSGSDGTSPDLIALRSTKKFALECKAWKKGVRIEGQKMNIMKAWEQHTGIPVYIAWKKGREPWKFYPLITLRETPTGHTLQENDLSTGITFEEMVSTPQAGSPVGNPA